MMNIDKQTNSISLPPQRQTKSLEPEIRRPLLVNTHFFGIKTRKWAVAEDSTLLVYKSRRSQIICKRIPLKDATISFPTKTITKQNFKPSKAGFKLTYQNKSHYYLHPIDYEDYLQLKMLLELAQSGFEQKSFPKTVQKQEVQVDQSSPQILGILASSRRENSIENVGDAKCEEDLVEGSDLENTVCYNMSFYSNAKVNRKSHLEVKAKLQYSRPKKQDKPTRMLTHDDVSEGSRYSTVPQSNFNISELRTKRGMGGRNSIEHSQILDLNNSDIHTPKRQENKYKILRSATAFVGKVSHQRKESLPDNTLNDSFGPKLSYLSATQNAHEQHSRSKSPDQYDSFGPHLIGKKSPLELLLQDGDANLISKTLSHAREVFEDEEEQKVLERMQSKKDTQIGRNSTIVEKKTLGSFKHYLSREIYSMNPDGLQEENSRAKLESKKTGRLSHGERPSVEHTLDEAFQLFQNFELKEAKELFLSLSAENPRLKLFAIECDLIVLSLNGFKDLVDSCLQELSQLTMQLMHMPSSLKSNTNLHFENEITKAECIVFKGVLNVALNHKWQAFLCISESWRIVRKLEAQIKDAKIQSALSSEVLHRIMFAIGAFNLAFSLVPPTLKKILKVIGISPNKQLGLELLQQCWEKKFSRSMYAALLISCYHLEFELDSQKACDVIEKAMIQYNHFPLFSWVGALLSWRFFQVNFLFN